MATLSAISKFLPATIGAERGRGRSRGGGITSWDNTFVAPILIWNGVNSQSKSKQITI